MTDDRKTATKADVQKLYRLASEELLRYVEHPPRGVARAVYLAIAVRFLKQERVFAGEGRGSRQLVNRLHKALTERLVQCVENPVNGHLRASMVDTARQFVRNETKVTGTLLPEDNPLPPAEDLKVPFM